MPSCRSRFYPGRVLDDATTGLVFQWNQLGDPFNPDQGLRTGDMFCFDSLNNAFCENLTPFPEYPGIGIPAPQGFNFRKGGPPLIFSAGRGSGFMHSQTFEVPGQSYGSCLNNPTVPCDVLGNDPCPDLGDVCGLEERGFRTGDQTLLPNGFPNPGTCGGHVVLIGQPVDPGTGLSNNCALPAFYPVGEVGDPGPGCSTKNCGSYTRPDINCDGVEDDTDGDGQPGPDKCPKLTEVDPFGDENADAIGDECQCGDVNGDGAVSGVDIGGTALCANGVVPCDASLVDATDDNSTTAEDIAGIVAVVNGAATTADLICLRKDGAQTP